GGITPKQLLYLRSKLKININLDTAHLVLDLEKMFPAWSHFKINQYITKFFKHHHEYITQLHLTQTKVGDQHRPINENGIVSCNKDILRLTKKYKEHGHSFLIMVESEIADKDKEYVRDALNDIQYFGYGNAVVNIILGWPLAGKSTASQILKGMIGPVTSSDTERLFYQEAISQNQVVPEEKKERVYEELLDRLSWSIQKGNPHSNIEATFALKSRRKKLFKILSKYDVKDIYIWNFERNEEDTKKRLAERAVNKQKLEKIGKEYPENVLYNYGIYLTFMEEGKGSEKPTIFSRKEIPGKLKSKTHVVNYNTSDNVIKFFNPNEVTSKGIHLFKEYIAKNDHNDLKVVSY
ncbi:hypothetical protein ACFL6D_04045, partial [Spirochaetota bacterium]